MAALDGGDATCAVPGFKHITVDISSGFANDRGMMVSVKGFQFDGQQFENENAVLRAYVARLREKYDGEPSDAQIRRLALRWEMATVGFRSSGHHGAQ
jgi:hypothetical protein